MDILKKKEEGRIVYRASNSRILLYQTSAFFFDPQIPNDEFKILQIQFFKPSEFTELRLEFKGIYDTGTYTDQIQRFRTNPLTRAVLFAVSVVVAVATFLGFCGIQIWNMLRKCRKKKRCKLKNKLQKDAATNRKMAKHN